MISSKRRESWRIQGELKRFLNNGGSITKCGSVFIRPMDFEEPPKQIDPIVNIDDYKSH